jgi:hypothetical protein
MINDPQLPVLNACPVFVRNLFLKYPSLYGEMIQVGARCYSKIQLCLKS